MSDNPLALLQGQQLAIPASVQALMEQTSQDDLQSGVGASFAVVSIKGKVFQIKYGGHSTPILMTMNGQQYAAPFFDVVIPKARAELSKTYYPGGYTEGDDAPPTCWSEDGVNPLAPLEQRPLAPLQNGQHCTDCRLCPMNVFGSKMTDDGRKAKACSDTRKLLVVPMAPSGQVDQAGNPVMVMDGENAKFGGPMLVRVPAASLKPFAEYGAKLQAMGLPYYGVVTRLEFDPTQAFPKFVLKAVRGLSEAEGAEVVRIRDSAQARQILEGSHTSSAPPAALGAPVAALQAPVAAAPAPLPAAVPVPAPVPATAAPVVYQQAPVAAPAPVVYQQAPVAAPAPLPPPPVAAPAARTLRMTAKAAGDYTAYQAAQWNDEQMVNAGVAEWVETAPVAIPAPPVIGPPPVSSAAVAAAPAPVQAAVNVSEALLSRVDSLLQS